MSIECFSGKFNAKKIMSPEQSIRKVEMRAALRGALLMIAVYVER